MSRQSRTILIVVGILVLLGLCACCCVGILVPRFAARAAHAVGSDDPQVVRRVAREVADYDLPSGWRESWSVNLFGFAVVGIEPGTENGHVFLAKMPSGLNISQRDIQRFGREAAGRGSDSDFEDENHYITSQTYEIRGQQVEFAIYEGANSEGDTYRSMNGMFRGRGGPTVLSINMISREWDQEAIDQFIGSIR